MATNMPQMAAGGPVPRGRPQNNQLSNIVYQNIMQNPVQPHGWQSQTAMNLRVRNAMNLITNSFLALPQLDSQHLIVHGLQFEREAFGSSPEKGIYDQKISGKVQELFRKRQAHEQTLHTTLSAQAQAQAQSQMMMNPNAMQMPRGVGQQPQPGFQHLQQMQASPMPQQLQQAGMGNTGGLPMNPNRPGMQMGMRPQMPQAPMLNLPPQERAKVSQLATAKMNQMSEQQKNQIRMMVQTRMPPQQMAQLQQEGIDPAMWWIQNQIVQAHRQPAGANQAAMQMQAQQQQRPMNQAGQQVQAPNGEFGPFSNVESIMNQQKAGLMAQEAGQMVVPASNGPGRNATPQPMGAGQNPNGGPSQQGIPHQMGKQFNLPQAQQLKMDQIAANTQAQIRAQAQAKQMQGQPGGINGAGAVSQSPAMNTLNTPMRRTPVGGGQVEGQAQTGQAIGPMGQSFDPRFNQVNQRPPMGVNASINRTQVLNTILASMPPETRSQFMGLPADKMPDLLMQYQAQLQAARSSGQMPGHPQTQVGQFGPGNSMAQYAPMNTPGPQPNQPMGMNAQQNQMLLQQQLNRLRNNVSGQGLSQTPADANALMDAMDVPQKVMENLRNQSYPDIPAEVKKWAQLKQWMLQKPQGMSVVTQLQTFQNMQFQSFLRRAQHMPQQGIPQHNMPQQNMPQQSMPRQNVPQQDLPQQNMLRQGSHASNGQTQGQTPQPNPNSNLAGPTPAAFTGLSVTPQELQTAKAHERFKGLPDDQVRKMIIGMKMQTLKSRQMQAQAGQHPMQAGAANISGSTQPAAGTNTPQQQQNVGGANGNPPDSAASARDNFSQDKRPQQTVQAPTATAPTAPPKKGVKRASADDVVEVSQPPPQQPQATATASRPIHQLTQQQIAALSPEQRVRYEAALRSSKQSAPGGAMHDSPELARLRQIGQEEQSAGQREQLQEISTSPEQYQEMAQKNRELAVMLNKIGRVLTRWYISTRDDARARQFFKERLRLIKQFSDGEKMTTVKEKLSLPSEHLDSIRHMLETMLKDLSTSASWTQQMRRPNAQQGPSETTTQRGSSGPAAIPPTTQQTPLNAANLEKQTQALSKIHQRSSSRGGQAPAAPTTSQPPFSLGSPSPAGNPIYGNKPGVTQENLQLPFPKKRKTGSGMASGGPSGNSSPQVPKMSSPDMAKRQAPQKHGAPPQPQFRCPEMNCEGNSIGFATEEAQRRHMEEEHIKPSQDPLQYLKESLALGLGLDENGHMKNPPESASPMTRDDSKQGQAPIVKNEAAMMSRGASMMRQSSGTGFKAGEAIKTMPGKTSTPKSEAHAKAAGNAAGGGKTEPAMAEMAWPSRTIDPQELFGNLGGVESGGGGTISNMNAYRSITPNDTPESIKDSASSEPNSDVSEGMTLNVTIDMGFDTWQPFEGGQYTGMDDMVDMDAAGSSSFDGFSWDDVPNDFGKPFQFDTSLYSLDTTS
ncbi:hypothetical protein F4778DRAFT_800612 [Xylariomycetidae sp. FL2044]|nr:hypothetical protein F4778DRAFT_800612 [Xylariomycetidae sp. FL2044]